MGNDFSAVILASGLSERMGHPKALLRWDESANFLEHIIREFEQAGCFSIVCLINEITESYFGKIPVSENVKFIINHHPDRGRFYSIKTGLNALTESPFCLIHNVDNPFVNTEILGKLLAKRNPGSWCSPVYKYQGGHPILISNKIIRKITESVISEGWLPDILNQFPKIRVETDNDFILRNINTFEEYKYYFGKEAGSV